MAVVGNVPATVAGFGTAPPGPGGSEEAQALAALLAALGIVRDGSGRNPVDEPAEALADGLRSASDSVRGALVAAGQQVQTRLDRLAAGGVRWPGVVLATDFRDGIRFHDEGVETPTGWRLVRTGYGRWDDLPNDHSLKTRLAEADAFDLEGLRRVIYFGTYLAGSPNPKPLPYLPVDVVVRQTLARSRPQQEARRQYLAQQEEEREAYRQAAEEAKSPHVRRLEAQAAEQDRKIAELSAQVADLAAGKKDRPPA